MGGKASASVAIPLDRVVASCQGSRKGERFLVLLRRLPPCHQSSIPAPPPQRGTRVLHTTRTSRTIQLRNGRSVTVPCPRTLLLVCQRDCTGSRPEQTSRRVDCARGIHVEAGMACSLKACERDESIIIYKADKCCHLASPKAIRSSLATG